MGDIKRDDQFRGFLEITFYEQRFLICVDRAIDFGEGVGVKDRAVITHVSKEGQFIGNHMILDTPSNIFGDKVAHHVTRLAELHLTAQTSDQVEEDLHAVAAPVGRHLH